MQRTLRLAPVALVLATVAAGCGSSGANSRAHLVAQADPICKQIADKRAAVDAELSALRGSTAKQLHLLSTVAPGIATDEHEAIARLRALKAPSSVAHGWQEMLSGMQQLATDDTRLARAAKAKDSKAVQSILTSGAEVRRRLTAIATSDGFTYCGRTS